MHLQIQLLYNVPTKSCGTKNARDRVGGVQMTNCFVHMIEFEQAIESCALPTQIYRREHSAHDWSRRRGLSRDTSDGLRYNWQAAAYISMFWSTCSIRPKLLPLHRGEVKHWLYRRGKPQYSISGSLEIQGMVRGYSFDIRFTLQCGNIQSGYSLDIPSMVFLLPARAHLVPNQGSSRPAFASRLKWDRVSLMGIRVEFETKCQCLYWSLIESLGKQKFAASDHPESPFLQKVGSGSGPTVSFPLIWLWQTGQPLAGC